jgi:hypothetical protein
MLPRQVDAVSAAIGRPGHIPQTPAARYLRHSIAMGEHDIYLGLAGVAIVTLAVVLVIIPRRFDIAAGAAADRPDS